MPTSFCYPKFIIDSYVHGVLLDNKDISINDIAHETGIYVVANRDYGQWLSYDNTSALKVLLLAKELSFLKYKEIPLIIRSYEPNLSNVSEVRKSFCARNAIMMKRMNSKTLSDYVEYIRYHSKLYPYIDVEIINETNQILIYHSFADASLTKSSQCFFASVGYEVSKLTIGLDVTVEYFFGIGTEPEDEQSFDRYKLGKVMDTPGTSYMRISGSDLHAFLKTHNPFIDTAIDGFIADFFGGFNPESYISNVAVEKIKFFLDRYSKLPTSHDISFLLNMSRSTFNRRLLDENKSFSELLKVVVLDKACHLLTQTNYSVDVISDIVGYSNSSGFIRYFKSALGITPSDYRRSKVINI